MIYVRFFLFFFILQASNHVVNPLSLELGSSVTKANVFDDITTRTILTTKITVAENSQPEPVYHKCDCDKQSMSKAWTNQVLFSKTRKDLYLPLELQELESEELQSVMTEELYSLTDMVSIEQPDLQLVEEFELVGDLLPFDSADLKDPTLIDEPESVQEQQSVDELQSVVLEEPHFSESFANSDESMDPVVTLSTAKLPRGVYNMHVLAK